jgi:arginase
MTGMADRWLVTPCFFERPEPALAVVAPDGHTVNAVTIPDRAPAQLARLHGEIARFVEAAVAEEARPISVAGDCCAAVPVLAGLRRAGVEPVLVWLDAHGDFNTPETSPSQFLGGMPLAMMVGRGPQWMVEAVGLAPLPEARVVLVDARDLDPAEAAAVAQSGVTHVSLAGLAGVPLSAPVHLHIDLDVIDSAEAPAFQYPVGGGPSLAEVAEAVAALAARADIAAISISGWTGEMDADGRTAAAAQRVLDAVTGSRR